MEEERFTVREREREKVREQEEVIRSFLLFLVLLTSLSQHFVAVFVKDPLSKRRSDKKEAQMTLLSSTRSNHMSDVSLLQVKTPTWKRLHGNKTEQIRQGHIAACCYAIYLAPARCHSHIPQHGRVIVDRGKLNMEIIILYFLIKDEYFAEVMLRVIRYNAHESQIFNLYRHNTLSRPRLVETCWNE